MMTIIPAVSIWPCYALHPVPRILDEDLRMCTREQGPVTTSRRQCCRWSLAAVASSSNFQFPLFTPGAPEGVALVRALHQVFLLRTSTCAYTTSTIFLLHHCSCNISFSFRLHFDPTGTQETRRLHRVKGPLSSNTALCHTHGSAPLTLARSLTLILVICCTPDS